MATKTPTNLNEYYTQKGQALPSIAERKKTFGPDYVPTAAGNAKQLNMLLAKDSGAATVPTTPVAPVTTKATTPTSTGAIGVDQMKPVAPIKVPPKTVDTTASNLMASATPAAVATGTPSATDTATQTTQQKVDTTYNDILTTLGDVAKASNTETQAFIDAGGNEAKAKADNYATQIIQEQRALEKRKNDILGGGATTEQAAAMINAENRQSASYQADLAILQSAASNDYERANTIAKQKADLVLQPLKARLDTLKFVYDNNKDLLTKEQDQAFQEKIRKEDQAFKLKQDSINYNQELGLLALKNGYSKAKAIGIMNGTIDPTKEIDSIIPNNGASAAAVKAMYKSKGGKDKVGVTRGQSLEKAFSTIDQLAVLSNLQKEVKSGFFGGRFNKALASLGVAPDAAAFQAALQGVVPSISRSTYGEVGVLTDNDVRLYKKTLPDLKNSEQQNKAIQAVTLLTVKQGLKTKLETMANSGVDVSEFVDQYKEASKKILKIEDEIGVSTARVVDLVKANPQLDRAVRELYQKGYKSSDILFELGIY